LFSQLISPLVSQDREHPDFQIAVGPQTVHRLQGAYIGFLNQILSFRSIARERHRIPEKMIHVAQGLAAMHGATPREFRTAEAGKMQVLKTIRCEEQSRNPEIAT
jgi:hypothetical protein